jgi:hypothetical protein
MCRSIKRLRPARGSDTPPPTPDEIEAAALQFVRKISGYRTPPASNPAAWQTAVEDVTAISTRLLEALGTPAAKAAS